MSQQSQSAFDTPDMDDAASEGLTAAQQVPPTRASAASSGRGRGRGRWARTKSTRVNKPPQQKTTSGRGRRHKVYDSLKAQAAHERTQELKQAFSAVVKLVKPAAQEIADRSVNELLEDPALYKQVPEYDTCKTFLSERHQDTLKQADAALEHGLAMAKHVWKAQEYKVKQEYAVSNRPLFPPLAAKPHPMHDETDESLCENHRQRWTSCAMNGTASFSDKSRFSSTSMTMGSPLM